MTLDEAVALSLAENLSRLELTARLHAGDPDNLALWYQFMPHCLHQD